MSISLFTLSCQCFTGDTLVSTEDGDVRIDEIRPGDKVWTNNVETGEKELQEVKSVKETKTDIIVHVITDDGNEIQTTMFHPFYVKDESKETLGNWVAASNLKKGDELLTEDGKNIKVSEVRVQKLDEEITVYNLEITEVHTYYVAGGVLVHNACADADAGGSRKNTGEGESKSAKTKPQQLTQEGKTPAIGKMKDLNTDGNVLDGEYKIADYLPDKGNPKANWKQNSGILRSVMNENVPIKDVSPFPMEKAGFLGAERNLLKSRGWIYRDGYWYSPSN